MTESNIQNLGLLVIFPHATGKTLKVMEKLTNAPGAQVSVLSLVAGIQLKWSHIFQIYESITMGDLARVGGGDTMYHQQKGLNSYQDQMNRLRDRNSEIIVFDDYQNYGVEVLAASIEKLWESHELSEWDFKFLTGLKAWSFREIFSDKIWDEIEARAASLNGLQA